MWRIAATFDPATGYRVAQCFVHPGDPHSLAPATIKDPAWLFFTSPRPIRCGHFVNPTKVMRELLVLNRQRVMVDRVLARHEPEVAHA